MDAVLTKEARILKLVQQGTDPETATVQTLHEETLIRKYISKHPYTFSKTEIGAITAYWDQVSRKILYITVPALLIVIAGVRRFKTQYQNLHYMARGCMWAGAMVGPGIYYAKVSKVQFKHLTDQCIANHWDEVLDNIRNNK